jgi:hypothetical protein
MLENDRFVSADPHLYLYAKYLIAGAEEETTFLGLLATNVNDRPVPTAVTDAVLVFAAYLLCCALIVPLPLIRLLLYRRV